MYIRVCYFVYRASYTNCVHPVFAVRTRALSLASLHARSDSGGGASQFFPDLVALRHTHSAAKTQTKNNMGSTRAKNTYEAPGTCDHFVPKYKECLG